jgi:hypothetical protein
MRTIIIQPPDDEATKQRYLLQERKHIQKFQDTLDEYSCLRAYIPDARSLRMHSDIGWIWSSSEVVLNCSVAVPVDDVPTARQYLWDCCCWATVLNTEGRGIKIGVLRSGKEIFCSRYLNNDQLIDL